MSYLIRKITLDSAEKVITEIGFDKCYIKKALSKYNFLLLKIHDLSSPQANIFKQVALSTGADAAVHRDVIICKTDKSDILLGATPAQIRIIAQKLSHQPFGLSKISEPLLEQIDETRLKAIKIRNTIFDWYKKTYIMGIINVTPDSFSDGGKFFSIASAIEQALNMIQWHVDIIDIGGESTRPFSKEIDIDEELKRVIPVIRKIRETNADIPISIDTRHFEVAKEALINGADIINDVSGFEHDPKMAEIAAEFNCPVVLMHSLSSPDTMQVNPEYSENVVDAVYKDLNNKVTKAVEAGIKKENIIIDPGIGFGKTLEHNIELIKRNKEFTSLGCPVLVGISRKSIIAKIMDLPPDEREEANIALAAYLSSNGANILRVHDVEKHYKALTILDRVINPGC